MSLLGMVNKFKHKGEIRESKDEILIGEMIYLLSLQGWPCIGFTRKIMGVEVTSTGAGLQNVRAGAVVKAAPVDAEPAGADGQPGAASTTGTPAPTGTASPRHPSN